MTSDGSRAALCVLAVLAGVSPAWAPDPAALTRPAGDAISMVTLPERYQDVGKPHVPPARVAISSPGLPVQTADEAEGFSAETAESRRRQHKRATSLTQTISDDKYYALLRRVAERQRNRLVQSSRVPPVLVPAKERFKAPTRRRR